MNSEQKGVGASASTPDQHAATVRDLRRDIISALIAVKGRLDTPYPDDERWTPWTRFVERALRDVDALAERATELEAEAGEWQARCRAASERWEAAEERATELERERDKLRGQVSEIARNSRVLVEHERERADEQEARADANLEDGLRERERAERAERERDEYKGAAEAEAQLANTYHAEAERAETALYEHGYGARLCRCQWCAALGETAP